MREPWIAYVAVAFAVSLIATGWLRRFALRRRIVDIPNSRSSHVAPTPRGGGLAIVSVVLSTLPLYAWQNLLSLRWFAAFFGAGLLVAAVGWLDDRGHVDARWRLVVHLAAAWWAVAWIPGLPRLSALGVGFDLDWAGGVVAVLGLMWLLNLYNFMDGIDGIAAIEAVTVCLGALLIYSLSPAVAFDVGPAVPLLLAAAVSGFLFWNFPHARIFMGDAGSGFVGLMLGLLALEAGASAPQLLWAWLILLGAFIVDATVTLFRRLVRGERVYQAHRTHAYQRAARRAGSHVPVTLSVAAVNLVWLLPIAILVALEWFDGAVGLAIAYAPLIGLAVWFGAGSSDESERDDLSPRRPTVTLP